MAMDRKVMETQIKENESQHRLANSLLRPRGLYKLWTEHEVYNDKKMPTSLNLPFVGQYLEKSEKKRANYTANFKLIASTFYDSESKGMKLFYYEFKGFKKN